MSSNLSIRLVLLPSLAFIWTISLLPSPSSGKILTGFKNFSVCTDEVKSNGLLPPGIPESFNIWLSITDEKSNTTKWVKETYDGLNMRGRVESVFQGVATHYIFDYLKNMVVTYKLFHPTVLDPLRDPGSQKSCSAFEISEVANFEDLPFGLRYGAYHEGVTRIYTPYQVLQFGGDYRFTFDKEQIIPERGIPVNTFRGCVYNHFEQSTYKVAFSWAKNIEYESINPDDPDDDNVWDIPVRKELNGGYYTQIVNASGETEQIWVPREEVHDILYFEGEPTLSDEDFQVPTHTACKFYTSYKPRPEIVDSFSCSLEWVVSVRDTNGNLLESMHNDNRQIWYNYDLQIGRMDFAPSIGELFEYDLISHFQYDAPVSAVYDFTTGIAYFTHKSTGQCFARAIPELSFFVSKKRNEDGSLPIADPYELFGLIGKDSDFQYKGKYVSRGIDCDVWSTTSMTEQGNVTKELYFSVDGFHTEGRDNVDTYDIPVRLTLISYTQGQPNLPANETIAELNIFGFEQNPDFSDFDIPNCISEIKKERLSITFDIEDKRFDVGKHLDQFIQNVRIILKDESGVRSPFRIQDLESEYFEDKQEIKITFLLLDNVDVKNTLIKTKGISLEEAKKNLIDVLKNSDDGLTVPIYLPSESDQDSETFEKIHVKAKIESLKEAMQL